MERAIGKTARNCAACISAVMALIGVGTSARATTITAGPTYLNTSTIGPGTAVGTLGYSFPLTQPGTVENNFYFQPGGAPFETHSLPSYLTVTYAANLDYYAATGYAPLNVNGDTTNGLTGFAYQPGSGAANAATAVPLATITLGAGVPSLFTIGVLDDTTGGTGDNTSVIFTGSDGTTRTVNSPVSTSTLSDDFYFVTVSNAVAGQTITLSGYNAGGGPGFAGIVFNSVPEPASMGLLALSAPLMMRRRKI